MEVGEVRITRIARTPIINVPIRQPAQTKYSNGNIKAGRDIEHVGEYLSSPI